MSATQINTCTCICSLFFGLAKPSDDFLMNIKKLNPFLVSDVQSPRISNTEIKHSQILQQLIHCDAAGTSTQEIGTKHRKVA